MHISHAIIKRVGVGKISKTFTIEVLDDDLPVDQAILLEQLFKDGDVVRITIDSTSPLGQHYEEVNFWGKQKEAGTLGDTSAVQKGLLP